MKRVSKIRSQAGSQKRRAKRAGQPSRSPLRITPARHGSGLTDVSIEHNRYFAER
jgi:hypothetical protein